MKIANKIAVGAIMFVSAVALAGCGTSSSTPVAKEPTSHKPLIITFGTWVPFSSHPGHEKVLKAINAANKGKFILKPIYIPPSGYNQKILVELAAGDAPNIFYLDYGYVNSFATDHTLLNLNPYLKENRSHYLVANTSDYYPSSLDGDVVNGKVYGLPYIDQPDVMYYSPALFKAAHLALPTKNWTWAQFLHDAKALTNPGKGQYGFLQANEWPPLEIYVWSYGGHMFNKAGTRSTIDSPAALKGLDLMQSMEQRHLIPSQSAIENLNIESLFRQGKVAMFLGGANDGNYTHNGQAIDTAIAPIPRGTEQITGAYTAEIAVNQKSPDPALVVKAYLDLLTGYAHTHVVSPVKQYAHELPTVRVVSAPNGHIPANRIPTILDSMKFARQLRPLKNMTKYYDIESNDLYDPILLGTESAKQAAQKTQTALNAFLKNENN